MYEVGRVEDCWTAVEQKLMLGDLPRSTVPRVPRLPLDCPRIGLPANPEAVHVLAR
jgi:hypothetical protein